MNTRLKISCVALALIFGFTSCEQSSDAIIENQENSSIPMENAVFPEETITNQRLLAKIQKDGHEYSFLKVGDVSENNILITEKLYGDVKAENDLSVFTVNDKSTPFGVFTSNTDNKIAVPEDIALSADDNVVKKSGRKITYSQKPVELLDANYSDDTIGNEACTDVGPEVFLEEYCGVPVISLPNDIAFCDTTDATSSGRTTQYNGQWKELTNTILITNVICGITRIQFYGWDGIGAWQLEAQVDYPDGIYSTKYTTSRKTERYVSRSNDRGSFRSYTRFVDTN